MAALAAAALWGNEHERDRTAKVSMLTPLADQPTLLTVRDVTAHFVLGDHNVLGYRLLMLVV